jgi:hypothetical protein
MTDEQIDIKLFDRIRADAEEKRKARLQQQQKTDEYFARIKNGENSLEEINRRIKGEK